MTHNSFHTTTIRRASSALGAAAILGLALSAPALARPEPGPHAGQTTVDQQAYSTHYGTTPGSSRSLSGSANAAENSVQQPKPAGPPAYNSWPNGGKVATPSQDTLVLKPIGNSIELFQVGLGALGGAALTAAAAAAMANRSRHHVVHA